MLRLSVKLPLLVAGLSLLGGCQKTTPTHPPVVDAGPSQVIQLPADHITLSGTATDLYSKIKGYLWSELSGPNNAVITAEGSVMTTVTSLVPGVYVFQLQAVDSLGAIGSDTLSVTSLPLVKGGTGVDTLFLQAADEVVLIGNSTYDGSPNNSATELVAETWNVGIGTWFNEIQGTSYFKFDLSHIPVNTSIKSAKLSLYSDPHPINGYYANVGVFDALYIQRSAGKWDSSTTWNTQPAIDTSGQVLIPNSTDAVEDLIDIDVTPMINKMLIAGNYGFNLQLAPTPVEQVCRIFCSAEYPDATKHPRLILTY